MWRIAKTYNIDLQDIAEANNITNARQIEAGQKIFIPGAEKVIKVKPYVPKGFGVRDKRQETEETEDKTAFENDRFVWPARGEIISGFGIRDGKRHDGIDISALEGTDVLAADDGEVIYSDNELRGYGNLIIIQHKDNFVTIYAHNKENIANVGQSVKRGELIAKVGNSGNSKGYHLHFEVRKDKKPMNPVFFLQQ
ncbi:MAG: peptidoglycan DD-metalloendopeptidase family protein [Deltaproteobacteria bacterium]|nr:peptidoglycan DD-metalloendopeptidase family protein [Deltaproteobacteria bacterium]